MQNIRVNQIVSRFGYDTDHQWDTCNRKEKPDAAGLGKVDEL